MGAFLPTISVGSSQQPRQEKLSNTEWLTHSHQPVQGRDSNAKETPPNPNLTSYPEGARRWFTRRGWEEGRGGESHLGPVGYSATWGGVDPVTSKLLGIEHEAAQNSRRCLMVVKNQKLPAERTVPTWFCTEALHHLCPTICDEVGEGAPFF